MRKRVAVSLAVLVTGAALLAAASFASPRGSRARKGGILTYGKLDLLIQSAGRPSSRS
jgi:hypothetical protein